MNLFSWNVNGLKACAAKGFAQTVSSLEPDFVCLQETKLTGETHALLLRSPELQGVLGKPAAPARPFTAECLPSADGYRSYWHFSEKKGYSGTAIITRHEPSGVSYGIGIDEFDCEGRAVTLDMPATTTMPEGFYLVCAYVPNAQDGLRRIDFRLRWEDSFRHYLSALDREKPVIVCGDLNVARNEIDLKNPAANRGNAGFSDEERGKMEELLAAGFTDTFRHFYPQQRDIYSWWSYRFRAREKNIGWRIDYFLVSNRILACLGDAKIHTDILGSDHCPVELDLL